MKEFKLTEECIREMYTEVITQLNGIVAIQNARIDFLENKIKALSE